MYKKEKNCLKKKTMQIYFDNYCTIKIHNEQLHCTMMLCNIVQKKWFDIIDQINNQSFPVPTDNHTANIIMIYIFGEPII